MSEVITGTVGLWKDEAAGYHITEWIAPQPRSYCYVITPDIRLDAATLAALHQSKDFLKGTLGTEGTNRIFSTSVIVKAKGIKPDAAKKFLTIDRFRTRERTRTETTRIAPHLFRLFNERLVRYVNFFDIKQYWMPDGSSFPYGHYSIEGRDDVDIDWDSDAAPRVYYGGEWRAVDPDGHHSAVESD